MIIKFPKNKKNETLIRMRQLNNILAYFDNNEAAKFINFYIEKSYLHPELWKKACGYARMRSDYRWSDALYYRNVMIIMKALFDDPLGSINEKTINQ